MQEVEKQGPGGKAVAAVLAAGSLVAAGGAIGVFGKATSVEIPEGSIGIKNTPSRYETAPKVAEVAPGTYWFGSLRFPDLRIVRLGAEQQLALKTTLTPATVDKLKTAAQKSLVAHKLLGDKLKDTESSHLEVESKVSFKIPADNSVDHFLERLSSSNFEGDVKAACNSALKKREDKLNARFWKPDMDKLNAEIGVEVAKALGLDSVQFQVTTVKRITLTDRDFAADRDATRKKVDGVVSGVTEVLFDIAAGALIGR